MKDLVSIDKIIEFLKESVEEKKVLPPSIWLDAAGKLNVLLGDEHDKLCELQQQVAEEKARFISEHSVAKAEVLVEAMPIHTDMKKQKAKITRIEEFIRIAKIQARLKDNEMSINY